MSSLSFSSSCFNSRFSNAWPFTRQHILHIHDFDLLESSGRFADKTISGTLGSIYVCICTWTNRLVHHGRLRQAYTHVRLNMFMAGSHRGPGNQCIYAWPFFLLYPQWWFLPFLDQIEPLRNSPWLQGKCIQEEIMQRSPFWQYEASTEWWK